MTKLIKPVMIDNIIRSGVVLKSKKAYKEISKLELTNLCAIRAHDNRIRVIYTTIVMQPRDSGKPDRMQSLNYMQYQYHCSVWYKRVSTI